MGVVQTVRALGGIAKTAELFRAGHSATSIRSAVGPGGLFRARKGWYCLASLDSRVIDAVRVGGKLACSSALAAWGVWDVGDGRLHVAVPRRSSRLRTPENHRVRLRADPAVVVHWSREDRDGDRRSVTTLDPLDQAFTCHGPDQGFVLLESARRLGLAGPGVASELGRLIPRPSRWVLQHAAAHSESGSESLLKLLLMRRRIGFRQQVTIGSARVDFLVGRRLVIEVDSLAHHATPTADRARDAMLSLQGYRVLRFMYSQIVHEPALVLGAVGAALDRNDHR